MKLLGAILKVALLVGLLIVLISSSRALKKDHWEDRDHVRTSNRV